MWWRWNRWRKLLVKLFFWRWWWHWLLREWWELTDHYCWLVIFFFRYVIIMLRLTRWRVLRKRWWRNMDDLFRLWWRQRSKRSMLIQVWPISADESMRRKGIRVVVQTTLVDCRFEFFYWNERVWCVRVHLALDLSLTENSIRVASHRGFKVEPLTSNLSIFK